VTRDDLRPVESGDALVIRGGWTLIKDFMEQPVPFLTLEVVDFMNEREVSILASDIGDRPPSGGAPMAIHAVALSRMGMPLIDVAETALLGTTCAELGGTASCSRWALSPSYTMPPGSDQPASHLLIRARRRRQVSAAGRDGRQLRMVGPRAIRPYGESPVKRPFTAHCRRPRIRRACSERCHPFLTGSVWALHIATAVRVGGTRA
jgi:hypothetical protein